MFLFNSGSHKIHAYIPMLQSSKQYLNMVAYPDSGVVRVSKLRHQNGTVASNLHSTKKLERTIRTPWGNFSLFASDFTIAGETN